MEVWSGWNASTRLAYALLFSISLALVMEKENTSKSGTDIIKGTIIPDDVLINKIHVIRDQKVMLDSDLAELYGVETKQLKRQVKRNIDRFPADFMFELTKDELDILRSQFGTLRQGEHTKYLPMVFTEHGVLMLSSVLNSKQAIQVNIQIMRIFTRIRQMLMDNAEIWREIAGLKVELTKQARSQDSQNKNIDLIFEYIDRLQEKMETPALPERKRIGYEIGGKK